ncbi:hypothetical protein [Streptomyces candidus]|uniref:DUF1449 family protein n=1 Tax=Streptomyces candidus TaxID=67283 RepID=A0A7X0HJV5_9ACTN|nr:hypothetical protein [Streptomyces candidus]MBB6438813.1 hypothetical protein [Streptomyces candidus]GHH52870.1 hypothetical protein GCM10018773_53580 [Streptomyces candidus]
MGEFMTAAAGFPTLLFTAALVVVVGFWLLVLCGAVAHDSFDGELGAGGLGLGGVAVAMSLLVASAWFLALSGSVLLGRSGIAGAGLHLLNVVVLLIALGVSGLLTRLLVAQLRRLLPDEPGPSRQDFVGLTCTIRTGRVDARFGQAEVAARDGSTAVVQVRQYGAEELGLGSTGLLYAYDEEGEYFWVSPYDAELSARG